jgi:hypothetical protein
MTWSGVLVHLKGPGGVVPELDPLLECCGEFLQRAEHAAAEAAALGLGKPALDLVDPGRVGGREVEREAGWAVCWADGLLMTLPMAMSRAANRSVVACLSSSKLRHSGTPGSIGRTGAVRSSAWTCGFSSALKTAAFTGGAR